MTARNCFVLATAVLFFQGFTLYSVPSSNAQDSLTAADGTSDGAAADGDYEQEVVVEVRTVHAEGKRTGQTAAAPMVPGDVPLNEEGDSQAVIDDNSNLELKSLQAAGLSIAHRSGFGSRQPTGPQSAQVQAAQVPSSEQGYPAERSGLDSHDNSHNNEEPERPVAWVDPELADISDQLLHLDFSRYRLLGSQTERLPLRKKTNLRLMKGDNLTVRPLYIEKKRVGLWLRWTDRGGMELLDTRLHVAPGNSMLAGTDSSKGCATLLAIKVIPAP